MRIYDIIDKKRNGLELTDAEIEFFVNGFQNGKIPDYQISPLLMAICINGMTDRETAYMTKVMAESGEINDLSAFGDTTVDKHSTGGVGDKTTLIIAPIVASLGCTVAKLSGRGLGHTGGTLDKLESIKGYRTNLSAEEFTEIAKKCSLCVCGAGGNIAPADKKLYALRDVTATVQSIPLIVSSIMSKKLAGGAKSIVLDVKTGSGAFMKTLDDARVLATSMVKIGKLTGKNMSAVITNMAHPLGYTIGNALEVAEAVALLRNQKSDDGLLTVCKTLATEMVSLSKGITQDEAKTLVESALSSGKAYQKFAEWITMQGGDMSVLDDLTAFTSAKYVTELVADCDGYIAKTDASGMGISAMMLGAGRDSKDDEIDMSAGIIQLAHVGDYVKKGQPIARFQSSTVADHSPVHNRYRDSLTLTDTKPQSEPIVYEIIR
ncbi:MAG: thymidine phosphorylase [Clostridia bacterium]|nr:thymidine phosphorylase [Clostridia bacterium]